MTKPLDELYFTWLYSQVGDTKIKNPNRTYWNMLKVLFTKEFVWLIPNDDNRMEDGKDLRYEFVDQSGLFDVDPHWLNIGCSMFELLVALSRRLAFEAEGEPREWFWHLISNLGLRDFKDSRRFSEAEVEHILDRVIWRQYDSDGHGGLFPLKNPHRDQRQVELWYQLGDYVIEAA
jgi:hypothetical protein